MNPLLILINNGEFISLDECVNFIITNKLEIHINDFIKYTHVHFFDFIDIKSIYDILIINHANTKEFIIDQNTLNLFKIKNVKKYIKKCKLVQNTDYIIVRNNTSILYYLSHFGKYKEDIYLTPFALKCILVYNNPEYVKYILLLELCINHHINYHCVHN